MIAVLALLGAAQPAFAQEPPVEEGWRVNVGAGGLYAPSYDGDDDYRLSVLPSIQINYGDTFFASVENGVGYRWINGETFRAGPIARVQLSRKEDGEQASPSPATTPTICSVSAMSTPASSLADLSSMRSDR